LSQDKITVDEPLISTDVDSLIRTLAERRKVSLNELRQICRIDKKTLDKWIAVLEDEDYISIEYGLGGTYVQWKGSDNDAEPERDPPITPPMEPEAPAPELKESEPAEEIHAEEAPSGEQVDPAAEEPHDETAEEFAVEMPLEDSEPEELLSQYLDRKKRSPQSNDSMKSSILSSLEGSDKEERREEDQETVTEAPEEFIKDEPPEDPPAKEELVIPRATAADIRDIMGTYLKEINREKARIEDLKKEKDGLYRDKFATMDGRMQADMVLLMEKILDKQSQLAELKERVLELPDKVDELGKLQEQMTSLKREGREALQRTKEKANEYLVHVKEAKTDIKEKVAEANAAIKEQGTQLKELEKVSTGLDARSDKLKATVEEVNSKVDELHKAMESLGDDLQKVGQMKSDAQAAADAIKEIVAARGSELESLEQELEGIARVEHWVHEYIRDYEQKIEDVERYVASSDEDLAELKEASEALYMKKYLGELEKMADNYDDELHDAVTQEQDIEQRMSESKSRVSKLVSESQQMVKKLRGEMADAKDYDSMLAKIKQKTGKAKTVFEEKREERVKLVDDSKKTRKTKSSGKVKLKSVPKKKKK